MGRTSSGSSSPSLGPALLGLALLQACASSPGSPARVVSTRDREVLASAPLRAAPALVAETGSLSGAEDSVGAPAPTARRQSAATEPADPWERFGLSAGGFLVALDGGVRFGAPGVGVEVNLEELLGFDTTTQTTRLDGYWRFTENRRHRFDLSWVDVNRRGSKTISQDLDLGGGVILPLGTDISSKFNLSLFKAQYSYSIFQDERLDLAAAGGIYVAPIEFQLDASGVFSYSDALRFTAPLPTVGLRMDFAVTPRWYLRSDLGIFYLEYDDYVGTIADWRAAVEYRPWNHVALGLGLDSFKLQVESNGTTSIPGVNRLGAVDFSYTGLLFFLKLYF